MARNTLKGYSKVDWTTEQETPYPGDMKVIVGCLQRIADAAEKTASNYTQLQNDRDWYRDRCKTLERDVEDLKNSRAGYKAALTRLRNETASHQEADSND
jgi:predicted  nucleic acid-binding Zn-ribbon protein